MVEKKRKAKKPKKKVIHQKQKQKQSISITIDNSKKSVARASGTKQMSGLGSSSSSSTVIPYGTYTSFQQQPMMQPMLQPPIQQPQNLANQQLAPIPQQGQYLGQAPAQYPNYNLPSVRTLQGADTLSAISNDTYDTFDTDSRTSIPHLSAFSPSQHTMSAFVLPPQPYNLPVSQPPSSQLSQASMNTALFTPRRPPTPPPPPRRQPQSASIYSEDLENGGFIPRNLPQTPLVEADDISRDIVLNKIYTPLDANNPIPPPPIYKAPQAPKERKERTNPSLMFQARQTMFAIDPQKNYKSYEAMIKYINKRNNRGYIVKQDNAAADLAVLKDIQNDYEENPTKMKIG